MMNKTKGIVMRTSPKLTVIFTDQGEFLEIPTPKDLPKLGQRLEVITEPPRIPSFRNSWLKYSTAAVLLLVLSITAFSLLFIPNIAVASVSLDINHGIELLVNNQGKVIKVRDVNGASSILVGISVQGLDVYQTVNLIVKNANSKGMLDETQNLVLASVVPINSWGSQMIDTEKLRNTIRDDMIHLNLSGSVVVGQTTQKIRREAQQQGMTVNSYLIYDRCEGQGIAVQPDSLRNNAQKALMDADVSIASLFPEECLSVRAQNKKDNSRVAKDESNVPEASEHDQSSTGGSSHEPTSETAHDLNEVGSGQGSTNHGMPESSSQQQPMNSYENNEEDTVNEQEHSRENEENLNNQTQFNEMQSSDEHIEGRNAEVEHMEMK